MGNGAASAEPEVGVPYGVERLVGLARRRIRLILCCAAAATGLALVYAAAQAPVYRATVELLVDPQALQVVGRDIVRADSSASLDFANVDSQALVMVSSSVLRGVVESLHLADDPAFQAHPGPLSRLFGAEVPQAGAGGRLQEALDLLRQAVVVHRVDNSLVFQVTVSGADATRAAAIANGLAQSYLKEVARERVDAVGRSNASLVAQVSDLRRELDAAEAAAERFRAENGLIRSSDTGLVVTQQLKDLYTQIDGANAEVARLAARKDQLAQAAPEALLNDTVPEAMTSATVIALRSQYAQTARELASLGQTLLPQHPRIQEVRAELDETQRLLKAEFARIRASVATAYGQAVANLAKLQARARDLTRDKVASSAAEIKLRQLESEAEAIRAVFNASLGRARELEQQGRIATSNSRVLSGATPPLKASKPPLAIVLGAAALFGACAGLGIAFLLDVLPRGLVRRTGRVQDLEGARNGAVPAPAPVPVTTPVPAPVLAAAPVLARLRRWDPGEAPPEGLAAVARELQQRIASTRPTVVAVAGAADAAALPRLVAEALGQILAGLGEEVLVCDALSGRDGMRVRHLAPRAPSRAAGLAAAVRRFAKVAKAGGRRCEVVLAAIAAPDALGTAPDAIVLALDAEASDARALDLMVRRFDPAGGHVAAVVALDGARGSPDLRVRAAA